MIIILKHSARYSSFPADTHLFMQFLDPGLRTLKTVLILYIIDDNSGLRSSIIHGS